MTRSRSGRTLLAMAFVVALFVTSCRSAHDVRSGEVSPPANDGPNIVLISTDDQALIDLRWMPLTRRLIGDAGVDFTNFIAPHPLCCPARAQILTGQYAQNNGVRGNRGQHGGYPSLDDPEHTLPVWLRDAGYRTSFVGKYVNGYHPDMGIPPGWEDWDATVRLGYQHFLQYDGSEVTQPEGYHTDYVADRTTDKIAALAADDQPFFLWSSFYAPHGICSATHEIGCSTPPPVAPAFADSFKGVRPPFLDKPSFNESDVSDKPREVTRGGKVDVGKAKRLFLQRLRSLASVDRAVAEIVAALRATGELEDTVIAFTSDNGFLYGEHRYQGKTLAYEESLRVPLLMRGPGITPGSVRTRTTAMIDLAPTFADLAGAEPLVPVDGESMVDLATGSGSGSDRTLLVQAGIRGPDRRGLGWDYRGVRTDRYTFIYWMQSGFTELYDRTRDPFQLRNVAHDPQYATIVEELLSRTRELGACSGDSCRTEFGPVPPPLR
jgi:N-acetylglucosamine-6-sulfatase